MTGRLEPTTEHPAGARTARPTTVKSNGNDHPTAVVQRPAPLRIPGAERPAGGVAPTRPRIASVDLLRGLVMIVMALDHVRNYFATTAGPPEALADPGLALFLTRWITHFCAPVFVFLAGVSAWLYRKNTGAGDAELRRFLISRGAWLVVAEFLLINPLWPLWIDGYVVGQVIWAIGWSMVVLGLALPLGRRAIGMLGLLIVFGHNLLDGISAEAAGALSPLWMFLHEEGLVELAEGWHLYIVYPVLPWIGVMMTGYAAGWLLTDGRDWKRTAYLAGGSAVALFVLLRVTNLYGNPADFAAGATLAESIIHFLNVEKYPPSLQYLLMTLGPALLLMPVLERWNGRAADRVSVFGRVPFFYYVLHFALIYAAAIAWSYARYGQAFWWFRGEAAFPPEYHFNLASAYVVWVLVVAALYPACRWYAGVKRRRRDLRWLSS